jgi:hypothetical protein
LLIFRSGRMIVQDNVLINWRVVHTAVRLIGE